MRWEDVAYGQAGVISHGQLTTAVGEHGVDGLVRRRDLVEVQPGVYRSRATPPTRLGDHWAAVLWSGGFLSLESAAQVWGQSTREPAKVQVTVQHLDDLGPGGRGVTVQHLDDLGPGGRGVTVHRHQLPDYDVTSHCGLPITTRDRTVIDMLGRLSLPRGRELLAQALEQRWVELWQLDRRVVDGRGRAGNVKIRQLRLEADPGAKSAFERRFEALLRRAGVTGWEPQYPVTLKSGAVVTVDIAFPAQRLIVELDGWAWHGRTRFRKDRKRWRGNVVAGWRVVQFTWDDMDDPLSVLAELADLLTS